MSTPNRPGSGPGSPTDQSDRANQPRQSTRPQPTRPAGQPAADANTEPQGPAAQGASGQPPLNSAAQPPQGARPQARPPQAPGSGPAPADKGRPQAPRSNGPQQSGPAQQSGPQQPPRDPLRANDGPPPTAAFRNTQGGPNPGPQGQGTATQGNGSPGEAPAGPPPWQRGGQRDPKQGGPQQGAPQQGSPQQGGPKQGGPQQQPQTNLPTRGGALPHGGPGDATATAPQRPGQPGAAGAENPEAKTQRREAAKSKAAGIDGPTRNIERKDLAKDMPDLSEVRHSEPAETQRVAHPVAVAGREEGEALRATVQLRKIDPWSTLKISLVIAVSLFFVWMVAVGLLYAVLDGMGVWDRLNSAFTDIVSESGEGGLVSAGQVFGYAAVIGLINVVLFTALTTIGSFIYNLSSALVGGVEVTLADRD